MTIAPFLREDLDHFMSMAQAERWIVDAWEFDFLLGTFPQGCFCARDKADRVTGFVTSLRHDRSGWIGNLIVSPGSRGSGIGKRLFLKAREVLYEAGVQTIWLTASKAGRPLYEKHGFSCIDSIIRWIGLGNGSHSSGVDSGATPDLSIDRLGWDDNRERLLSATAARGRVQACNDGFTVIQPCNKSVQIGPFAALHTGSAGMLLANALASIPPAVEIYIDAPARNEEGTALLQQLGFRKQGANELMYAGRRPAYRPECIYGLASMGSMG
jgi:ribosomal protein S18 acetylase RimI-like enzyme